MMKKYQTKFKSGLHLEISIILNLLFIERYKKQYNVKGIFKRSAYKCLFFSNFVGDPTLLPFFQYFLLPFSFLDSLYFIIQFTTRGFISSQILLQPFYCSVNISKLSKAIFILPLWLTGRTRQKS